MIKNYRNSIADLLDEGYTFGDLRDILEASLEEYKQINRLAMIDALLEVFSDFNFPMKKEDLAAFVKQYENKPVINSTEEKCEEPTKCSCETKNVAEKKLPNGGYIKVKTNTGDADEVLAQWMKQIGLRG